MNKKGIVGVCLLFLFIGMVAINVASADDAGIIFSVTRDPLIVIDGMNVKVTAVAKGVDVGYTVRIYIKSSEHASGNMYDMKSYSLIPSMYSYVIDGDTYDVGETISYQVLICHPYGEPVVRSSTYSYVIKGVDVFPDNPDDIIYDPNLPDNPDPGVEVLPPDDDGYLPDEGIPYPNLQWVDYGGTGMASYYFIGFIALITLFMIFRTKRRKLRK